MFYRTGYFIAILTLLCTGILATAHAQLRVTNSTDDLMVVKNDGKVGIGITQPKAHLDVIGSVSRVSQIGDWTGEGAFDYSRFGIHVRLDNTTRDVSTQDAIRGTTRRPDGSPQGGLDSQFFTGVRGMVVTPDRSHIMSQGILGYSQMSNSFRREVGVSGTIVNTSQIRNLANEIIAIRAEVLDNSSFYDNVWGLYVSGAKSYFQNQIGLGSATNPRSGAWIDVDGRAYCDGMKWREGSSREFKTDITPLDRDAAQQAFSALEPVTYRYKTNLEDLQVGFIAEDVPELVADPGRKSLTTMDITGVLTSVVQQQQEQIKSLTQRVQELENKLAR
jgi:hypothetical protein